MRYSAFVQKKLDKHLLEVPLQKKEWLLNQIQEDIAEVGEYKSKPYSKVYTLLLKNLEKDKYGSKVWKDLEEEYGLIRRPNDLHSDTRFYYIKRNYHSDKKKISEEAQVKAMELFNLQSNEAEEIEEKLREKRMHEFLNR
ncbi:MAG: hypothetical protein MUP58_02230 [Candidatus Nanohaloarchaeota archaeon QJJ-9]|nr:hypothetical protein [Candidatus Nanohaloarchaeota archaeon QJJ-9]